MAAWVLKGKDSTEVPCGAQVVFMVKPVITRGNRPVCAAFREHTTACPEPGWQFAPNSTPNTSSGPRIVPYSFSQPIPMILRAARPCQRTRFVPG